MNNTIYIADTCTLRMANARKALHKALHADADRRLLILASVRAELERQATEENKPKDIEEATAALTFLQQEYLHVIHLPESDDYPKGVRADNEILYYCYTHRNGKIILYTEDEDLTNSVLALCPHVQVLKKSKGTRFTPVPETFKQQYDTLLQPFCCIFCTAAALNLAADNGADRFLLPGKKIILSKVSLCGLTLNGHEALREHEKHVTLVNPAGAEVTEFEELSIRVLTHRHIDKTVLLLLAEDEDSKPYLRNGQFLPCSENNGFAVAALCKNGHLRILAPAPTIPVKPSAQEKAAKAEPKQPKQQQKEKAVKQPTAQQKAPTPTPLQVPPTQPKQAPAVTDTPKVPALPQPPAAKEEVLPWDTITYITKQPLVTKVTEPKPAAEVLSDDVKRTIEEKFKQCKNIAPIANLVVDNDFTIAYGIEHCLKEHPQFFHRLVLSLTSRGKKFPQECFKICVFHMAVQNRTVLEEKLKEAPFFSALKNILKNTNYSSASTQTARRLQLLIIQYKDTPAAPKLQELLELAYANGAPIPR